MDFDNSVFQNIIISVRNWLRNMRYLRGIWTSERDNVANSHHVWIISPCFVSVPSFMIGGAGPAILQQSQQLLLFFLDSFLPSLVCLTCVFAGSQTPKDMERQLMTSKVVWIQFNSVRLISLQFSTVLSNSILHNSVQFLFTPWNFIATQVKFCSFSFQFYSSSIYCHKNDAEIAILDRRCFSS